MKVYGNVYKRLKLFKDKLHCILFCKLIFGNIFCTDLNNVNFRLKEAVLNFKQNMPLIAALRNTCLKQRHWDEIQYAIGRSLTRDASLTLGELLKWRVRYFVSIPH